MRRFVLPPPLKRNSLMPFDRFAPFALALALAGCGSVGAIGVGPMQTKPGQNVELAGGLPPAVPSDQVPNGSARAGPAPVAPGAAAPGAAPNGDVVASAAPAPAAGGGAGGLGRTDLLGGWTIAPGGESCPLFMTLTSWTRGYPAPPPGFNDRPLEKIFAGHLARQQAGPCGYR